MCLANYISLDAEWIPRESNKQSDLLSRFIDKDDWSINPSVFRMIDVIWGPHTCDRFASYYNAQLPVFNSRFASPGSSGVDAFAQDWSGANNWLCPPVELVVPVVRKLQSCRGRGTLIVPEWPSSMFWPFLRLSPLKFKPYVREVLQLPRISELSIEGPGQRATYRTKKSVFSSCPAFDILALRLDFAH